MQYFAAQYQPGQQTTHSLRASQYRQSKRKREEDADEDERSSDGEAAVTGAPVSLNAQSRASSASLESVHLGVAGLLPDDAAETPPKPFPHAPVRSSRVDSKYISGAQKHLADLDPPLYPVTADPRNDAQELRQTHLSVLTTIVHRCLLEGDYSRAGRAWGMILRSQIAGSPVDLRNHGRWGIGAEILLRRKTHGPFRHRETDQDITRDEQLLSNEDSIYTEEGFQLAREYYERLIVQHPNRRNAPHAVNDLTFYPAMFSLWIYEVCERSKRARKHHATDYQRSPSGSGFDEDTTMDSETAVAHASAIIAQELQEAREIASRLDQLIISPPFDKHADLLQLRGMVALWTGDLMLKDILTLEDDWSQTTRRQVAVDTRSASERFDTYFRIRREFELARDVFIRAQTNGRRVADAIYGAEAKIDDLTRELANLGDEY